MKEGDKVHYVDSWGDIHTVRISYLFTSVMGNECAALNDGATKLVTELVEVAQ
ncbi:hypothetical protein Kp7_1 [Klebsiella phage Kp7]|uniref:Uncharacterized protein n=1 Tax=Klebsiella phage Kp7 TaxID=2936515 RepID=A0AAE9KWS5_9CAUD|nr:hypothetical protein Kp7_1 [Klebsiella phage Kp7]